MEKQQSLTELFKTNKLVGIGVPVILLILLLDTFVLRPSRKAKELEKRGIKRPGASTVQTASTSVGGKAVTRPPIAKPTPIQMPVYPPLSPNITLRFVANSKYPFQDGRNIFIGIEKPVIEIAEIIEQVEEVIEKPSITYHGFFSVGNDKVAILRKADEVLLTKVGSKVRRTDFQLNTITPEKVIMSDTTEKLKDFEIYLADATESE